MSFEKTASLGDSGLKPGEAVPSGLSGASGNGLMVLYSGVQKSTNLVENALNPLFFASFCFQ